ncbi:MEDS domain-containing protein [Nocardioides sediminis]|uniref:MEDS domain-containing protein n=1 Tax=Nocardioides sediminis TaxID=433648 RepID=UPI000D31B4F6|nr:MEDS domain-containing protein [Nocardioides sediminis]
MLIPSVDEARTGQHLCQVYDSDDGLRRAVSDLVGSGLAAGDLIIHVTGSTPAEVRSYLRASGVDCGPALERGQVRIISRTEVDGSRDEVLAAVLDRLSATLEACGPEGYAAARIASEVDVLYGAETVEKVVARERLGDELVARHPVLVLCLYDRRLHDPDRLRRVEALHEGRVAPAVVVHRDDIVAIARLEDRTGLRVFGELDLSNRDAFADAVATVARSCPGDVVVDMTDVSFIDLDGIAVLVRAAERHPDRSVVLLSPNPMVHRVLVLTGWDALPNLVLDHADTEDGRP